MTPAAVARHRQSAEDRRAQVVEAALREFADLGYEAASTAAIARRAGISQPYIYALFPNKQELFLAVHDRVIGRIRDAFRAAVHGVEATPQELLGLMGATYPGLISDRLALLLQLQCYAASGNEEIRVHVARAYRALVNEVTDLSGANPVEIAQFLAAGMLANITTALGVTDICEPLWAAKHQA